MRMAFIGHYYHKSTKSIGSSLTRSWPAARSSTSGTRRGWASHRSPWCRRCGRLRPDCLLAIREGAADAGARPAAGRGGNIVFVPVWDGCRSLGTDYWESLAGLRIASFRRGPYERVTRYGLFSHSVRYFPDLADFPDAAAQPDSAVFPWWRMPPRTRSAGRSHGRAGRCWRWRSRQRISCLPTVTFDRLPFSGRRMALPITPAAPRGGGRSRSST